MICSAQMNRLNVIRWWKCYRRNKKRSLIYFFFFRCVRSRKRENADERRGSKIDNVIDLDDVHVIQSSFFLCYMWVRKYGTAGTKCDRFQFSLQRFCFLRVSFSLSFNICQVTVLVEFIDDISRNRSERTSWVIFWLEFVTNIVYSTFWISLEKLKKLNEAQPNECNGIHSSDSSEHCNHSSDAAKKHHKVGRQ